MTKEAFHILWEHVIVRTADSYMRLYSKADRDVRSFSESYSYGLSV